MVKKPTKRVRSENARALDKLLKKGGPVAVALRRLIPPTTLKDHRTGAKVPGAFMVYVYDRYGFMPGGWLTAKELKAAEKLVDQDALRAQWELNGTLFVIGEQHGRSESEEP